MPEMLTYLCSWREPDTARSVTLHWRKEDLKSGWENITEARESLSFLPGLLLFFFYCYRHPVQYCIINTKMFPHKCFFFFCLCVSKQPRDKHSSNKKRFSRRPTEAIVPSQIPVCLELCCK